MVDIGRSQIKLVAEYNSNGQPTSVFISDKLLAKYEYNSRAERIAKTRFNYAGDAIDTTHYLYEGRKLIAEANADGEIARQYLYMAGKPVSILEGKKTYAVHTNHLGAPIAVTDKKRNIIWEADYAPYGRAFFNPDPDKDGELFALNIRLPGQYADAETGLHYNYYRFYDPDAGRYLQSDPLGLNAGLNTYAYVNADPVNNVDPLGLLLFAFDGTENDELDQDVLTNVVHLRDSYSADADEVAIAENIIPRAGNARYDPRSNGANSDWQQHAFYITGAGTEDHYSGYNGPWFYPEGADSLLGGTMPDRVQIMAGYLARYIDQLHTMHLAGEAVQNTIQIDITGFSRGAVSARMFASLVDNIMQGNANAIPEMYERAFRGAGLPVGAPNDGAVEISQQVIDQLAELKKCNIDLNLRYLGLFDSVPAFLEEHILI